MGIINSAPLSMGLYTKAGAPKWHNAPSHVQMAVELAFKHCDEKQIDLTKLALYFSTSCPLVDLTVVSMSSEEIVASNVDLLATGLNENERKVLEEIRNL